MSKKAWVADVWNLEGDGGGWTPLFSRAFNDWELEWVERFLQNIQAIRVHMDVDDKSDLDSFEVWDLFGQISLFYLGIQRFSFVS